jgi:hypothetical protein
MAYEEQQKLMAKRWRLLSIALFLLGGVALQIAARTAWAQSTISNRPVQLWVDTRSGQVFIRPGPHRVRLNLPGTITEDQLNSEVEQKVDEKTQAIQTQLNQQQSVNASLAQQNSALTQQVTAMKPDWKSYAQGFAKHLYIGTVFYGDYGFYTHTAFGPAFLQNQNMPGQGNNNYNSFDITRTYINFLFTPTDDLLFRFTPDIYRAIGSSNDKFGQSGAIGSTLDGNLAIEMKYAYVQYKGFFKNTDHFKGAFVNFGAMPNPIIPWEEDLNGYRFVYEPPWNYLGLSSSQDGLSMGLPYKVGERTYIDSEFGVYNNASFKQLENTDTKQVMARVSAYPFGALWRFDGLGITGFYNYGYGNTTPDLSSVPTALKGPNAHITRVAAILHYTTYDWQLAGEYDYGHNAFSTSNLWSGSAPGDAEGFPTCLPAQTGTNTCTNPKTPPGLGTPGFADTTTLAQALLNNGRSEQEGFAFFGRYRIPTTPVTLFGIFQLFQPNTNVAKDPFDFQRWVVGVSYQYNEYLRLAIDSDNLDFYEGQYNFPTAYAKSFNSGASFTPLSKSSIADAVPRNIHSLFLHVEFDY